MAGHSEGDLVGEFCTQRKASCDKHSEKYRETNCGVVAWRFQAHHVICVASVTQYISAVSEIEPIVTLTKWCVNRTGNMIAMPDYMGVVFGNFAAWAAATPDDTIKPPYADIPVHGYDHNSKMGYKSEIDTKMKALADDAKRSKAKHETEANTLMGALNTYQKNKKPELKNRGTRGLGTYGEWLKVYSGQKAPDSDWYVPFSMADEGNIEPRTYPTGRVKSVVERVKEIITALL